MKKTNKIKITIGIAAFNEADNIGNVLSDLYRQRSDDIIIEKIIVVSDGSTDKTNLVVKSFQGDKNYDKNIVLIKRVDRGGKAKRLNEIVACTQSDILVFLDADIRIFDQSFLSKLTAPLVSGKAELSSCNYLAQKPVTIVGKALATGLNIKNEITSSYQGGNNLYTCHGTALALSKKLYEKFSFNESIGEDMHLYLYVKKNEFSYQFAGEAELYIKLPNTLEDHWRQSVRFKNSKHLFTREYGSVFVSEELSLPLATKFKATFQSFIKTPVFTMLYFLIYIYFKLKANSNQEVDMNWEIVKSTKDLSSTSEKRKPNKKFKLFLFIRKIIYLFLSFSRLNKKLFYPKVFILSFHSIANDKWRYSIDEGMFKKQISYLLKNFDPIRLSEAREYIEGKKELGSSSFVITFDDGYADNITIADYLLARGIYPTIFILSEPENAHRNELETDKDLMTKGQLMALAKKGWELGCHSASHANFDYLDDKAIEREIVNSKAKLEKSLGIKVKYFAYPKGKYNPGVKKSVKGAGYSMALSMDDRIISTHIDPYALPRIGVDQTHSLLEFKALFSFGAIYMRSFIKFFIKARSLITKNKNKVGLINKFNMIFTSRLKARPIESRLSLPQSIDNYSLVEEIYRPPGDEQYELGIYRDKQGRQGIAKQWSGTKKDIDYYWLNNEIKVYQGLESLYKKKKEQIKQRFSDIHTPKLLKTIEEDRRLLLFIERLDGRDLENIPFSKSMEIFEKVVLYFQFLGNEMKKLGLDKYFLRRSIGHTIIIYFFMLFKATLRNPDKIREIIKSSLVFMHSLPWLLKNNQYTLVHRDLTLLNILLTTDEKIGVIDFELCVFTHPLYEITQIVTGSWRRENFKESFYKLQLMKKIMSDKNKFRVYRSLSIFTAIHRLATSPKSDLDLHYSYLKHLNKLEMTKEGEVKTASSQLASVTIGITAYNEAGNIERLLESIKAQVDINYVLKKVIVVSDGSSDATDKEVREFAKKFPRLELIADGKRKGHIGRLNEIYRLNTSDILITLDGDCVLADRNTIEEIVECFVDPSISLVGGNDQPLSPKNFFEKIVTTHVKLWYQIRKDINQGDTVYNLHGCVVAMRQKLARKIVIPQEIIANDTYLYFRAKKLGYNFKYAKKAIVNYRAPNNLKDYLSQTARFINTKDIITNHFGEWVNDYRRISKVRKLKALLIMLIRRPVSVLLGIALKQYAVHVAPQRKGELKSGFWSQIKSTKENIFVK